MLINRTAENILSTISIVVICAALVLILVNINGQYTRDEEKPTVTTTESTTVVTTQPTTTTTTTTTTTQVVSTTKSTTQKTTQSTTKKKSKKKKKAKTTTKKSEKKDSGSPEKYSASYFRRMGVLRWGGWKWTWYSQRVLPGGGLRIPGRHVDSSGYVCDENDYICLASSSLSKGTVIDTPLGKKGKIYDSGCASDTIDVYVNW